MTRRLLTLAAIFALLLACSGDDPSANGNQDANQNQSEDDAGADSDAEDTDELSLESVYPVRGSAAGGDIVALYGTAFDDDAQVLFADSAADVTFISATELEVVTPGGDPGPVTVRVENPDGEQSELAQGFEYRTDDANQNNQNQQNNQTSGAVSWCILQSPAELTSQVEATTDPVYGRVYAEGCTDSAEDCPQLRAQLGWGNDSPQDWQWADATENSAFEGNQNKEFQAELSTDTAGNYRYAYRFAIDDQDWTYCDLDGTEVGTENEFSVDGTGQWTVAEDDTPPEETVAIGWCTLQWPPTLSADENAQTDPVFGRVYVEECTGIDTECELVTGQLGVGPSGDDPSAAPEAFSWIDASYNSGHNEDNNDEHQASYPGADTGTYGYAFRFSGDQGNTWTYCDLDGSDNGFDVDEMGELTVE